MSVPFVLEDSWDGEEAADAIIQHAIGVLSSGSAVNVDAYLDAIDGLTNASPEPVVAALLAGLRDLSQSGATKDEAEEMLGARYPELREWIDAASDIDRVFRTESVRELHERSRPRVRLPGDCGPRIGPDRVRRYRLIEVAGSGTQGVVLRAEDRLLTSDDQPAHVAIKFTRPHPMLGLGVQREAIRARRVDHPGVVRVIDCGLDEDRDLEYAVFEWVDGERLDVYLQRHPDLTLGERVLLAERVSDALGAMHRAGVVHCDLKPANILVDADGRPKVTDVGTSQLMVNSSQGNDIGCAGGTPAFMPAEQLDGAPVSTLFDVFALGAVFAWCLTGESRMGTSLEEVDRFHAERREGGAPSWGGGVDPTLAAIADRAMSYRPQDRYPNVTDLGSDLRRWREHRPIDWTQPALTHRARLLVRRRPVPLVLGAMSLLAIGLGSWIWHYDSVVSARESSRAEAKATVTDRLDGMLERFETSDKLPVENGLSGIWLLHIIARSGYLDELFDEEDTLDGLARRARLEAESSVPGSLTEGLWRLQSGYWFYSIPGAPSENAMLELELAKDLLAKTMSGDDPLYVQACGLLACARVKDWWHRIPENTEPRLSAEGPAGELARELEDTRERLSVIAPRSAVYRETLRSLGHLYGTRMMYSESDYWRIEALLRHFDDGGPPSL